MIRLLGLGQSENVLHVSYVLNSLKCSNRTIPGFSACLNRQNQAIMVSKQQFFKGTAAASNRLGLQISGELHVNGPWWKQRPLGRNVLIGQAELERALWGVVRSLASFFGLLCGQTMIYNYFSPIWQEQPEYEAWIICGRHFVFSVECLCVCKWRVRVCAEG